MELYTAGTGNGQRAAIAVNECGVSCKIHVLNLGQGDQKAADYLKINPTARIPTLIDPGGALTVTQSWAILTYLCEKTGKFLPADPVARVRMSQLPHLDAEIGAAHEGATVANLDVGGGRLQYLAGDRLQALAQRRYRSLVIAAGDHQRAAGESAPAVGAAVGVAGDDPDLFGRDADLVGD